MKTKEQIQDKIAELEISKKNPKLLLKKAFAVMEIQNPMVERLLDPILTKMAIIQTDALIIILEWVLKDDKGEDEHEEITTLDFPNSQNPYIP